LDIDAFSLPHLTICWRPFHVNHTQHTGWSSAFTHYYLWRPVLAAPCLADARPTAALPLLPSPPYTVATHRPCMPSAEPVAHTQDSNHNLGQQLRPRTVGHSCQRPRLGHSCLHICPNPAFHPHMPLTQHHAYRPEHQYVYPGCSCHCHTTPETSANGPP
jgi:hypothetical protein